METREQREKRADGFFDGEGRLLRYPRKKALREIVLARIAERLEYGRDYTEREVNGIIRGSIAFSDIELIRRELCNRHFVGRLRDGSKYWREEREE